MISRGSDTALGLAAGFMLGFGAALAWFLYGWIRESITP